LVLGVAAPREARAVAGDGASVILPWTPTPIADSVDLVLSGVGKANAAGATAAALARGGYGAVINLGVCGTLPGSPAAIGDVVLATRSVLADEGVESEAGAKWEPMAAVGFPTAIDGDGVAGDAELMRLLRPRAAHAGVIATVSTCSGTDARAAAAVARTGAIAEAMEGAAALLAAARLGVPGVELRVVSNTTGERVNQKWELKRALAVVGEFTRSILG
jgi:futalosine hydrolase